jgi:peptide/nickel transport system substrate-binding protein
LTIAIALILGLVAGACTSTDGADESTTSTDGGQATTTTTSAGASGSDTLPECPPLTQATGEVTGEYPGQFELAEYEAAAECVLAFSENPDIASLAAEITNIEGSLPPVADRLPAEPLVIEPVAEIGTYGGTLDGLARANEAGTADMLSVRHVNLVRLSPDLRTIMPNIAKSFSFNEDFTELTFELREGHRWSNGEPFTSEDVRFWLEDLQGNADLAGDLRPEFIIGGEPIEIDVIDDTTFRFVFAAPAPNFLMTLATAYWQPFQPDEFLKPFHPDYSADADDTAAEFGYESAADAIHAMWCPSNWKDCGSPWLTGSGTVWVPTLESHVVVDESTEARVLVANPYFHAVDTTGQQLPYIGAINVEFVEDSEIHLLRITNGETDYKSQGLTIGDYPVLDGSQEDGGYRTILAPAVGSNQIYSLNLAVEDPVKNEAFNDLRFRQAFSMALNRNEINDLVWFGQGIPQQYTPVDPNTVEFVTPEQLDSYVEYSPDVAIALLDEMGLAPDSDGCRIEIDLTFSDQEGSASLHELSQGYLRDVGICMNLKEVSSDDYRESAARNELDILTSPTNGTSGVAVVSNPEPMVPPFGGFFQPGPALHWAAYINGTDDGVQAVEPPADVYDAIELYDQFQSVPLGSAESDALGTQLVDIHVANLWKIGTVGSIAAPTIVRDVLKNVPDFTVHAYDFYWAYPFNPYQWFLTGE